jgi:hypothetical protein
MTRMYYAPGTFRKSRTLGSSALRCTAKAAGLLPERPVAGAEHPHGQNRIGRRMCDDGIREGATTARDDR